MNIKTAKDLISSLRASAFRRATFDGRTVVLRAIKTLHNTPAPGSGRISSRR